MDTEQQLLKTLGLEAEIKKVSIGPHLINYLIAGDGPPLLLIHGGNIGWGQWYPNIPELAKYFKVYALDLPGGGRSSRIDYKNLDLQRDLVRPVSDFITINKLNNLAVVGASVGGWIAAKIAAQNQLPVRKLVLVDAIGFSNYVSFSDRLMGWYSFAKFLTKTALKPTRQNRNIEKLLRSVFYDRNLPLNSEFINYFYDTMAESHNLLFISRLAYLIKKGELFLQKDLPQIKIPTLIIWGEQDKLMPLTKNLAWFNLLPDREIKIIKAAGHIPSIEKSAEFNGSVINFLRG